MIDRKQVSDREFSALVARDVVRARLAEAAAMILTAGALAWYCGPLISFWVIGAMLLLALLALTDAWIVRKRARRGLYGDNHTEVLEAMDFVKRHRQR